MYLFDSDVTIDDSTFVGTSLSLRDSNLLIRRSRIEGGHRSQYAASGTATCCLMILIALLDCLLFNRVVVVLVALWPDLHFSPMVSLALSAD